MGKRKMLIAAIVSALALTGCVTDSRETEKKVMQYAGSDKEETVVRSYDEIVADVDFSQAHIQVELRDKLTVEADITTEVPGNLGIYEYTDVAEANEGNETEIGNALQEKTMDVLTEYYGENDFFSVYASAGNITFEYEEFSNYMLGDTWEYSFPDIKSDYDEALVESMIDEVTSCFVSILPDGLSDSYRCLHFDEAFWKSSGAAVANDWVLQQINDKDYYWIRIYTNVEQGVYYNNGNNNVTVDSIGETSVPRAFWLTGKNDTIGNAYLGSYVDIYLDEYGSLCAMNVCDYVEIGQCIEVGDIISAKEALGKVYELYSSATVYKQITINQMNLCYMPLLGDEVDENGYRAAYLKPVWQVRYVEGNGYDYCRMIVVDAVTGEVIYKD